MKQTPLFEEHKKLGAGMAEFAGWMMPIQYSGIIQEHKHTRSAVSLFDICHMGEFKLRGASAAGDVGRICSARIDNLASGACRYSYLLTDEGVFIDDLIIYKISEDEFMLVVNASRIDDDASWIKRHISDETEFLDVSANTAKLDLQGPLAFDVLAPLADIPLDTFRFYSFCLTKLFGYDVLISRTGYTGELGCEIYSDVGAAVDIWAKLLADERVRPAGLGCRDTLRLEMGYPLFGNDISGETTPFNTGLMKNVDMNKDFIGKTALLEQSKGRPTGLLAAIKLDGRQAARHGCKVFSAGSEAGIVTSGSFAPSLGCAIALAHIKPDAAVQGNIVDIESGKRVLSGRICAPPFYKDATGRKKL